MYLPTFDDHMSIFLWFSKSFEQFFLFRANDAALVSCLLYFLFSANTNLCNGTGQQMITSKLPGGSVKANPLVPDQRDDP